MNMNQMMMGMNPMQNMNMNQMMMGMNPMKNMNMNQMMMGMNPMQNMNMNQMMIGMNPMQNIDVNQMMMAMNPMHDMNINSIDYMNISTMNDTNIYPNMGLTGPIVEGNNINNLNNLNGIEDNKMNGFMNKDFKTVRIFYQNKFIHNIDINENEGYYSIAHKVKSILYEKGIKLYRRPSRDEVVERTSPFETLENLLERGVIEEHPRVMITHKVFKYPNVEYHYCEVENGDIFNVNLENILYGAGGLSQLEFVDVDESTKTKKLKLSKNAPKWRKVSKGLNLFGKCINKKCEAYDNEVVYIAGINIKFDFNSDRKDIKCPMCSKNFIPNTMGFWKCEYQIKGEKLKNGDYEEVDINGKETKGDNFEYYDPHKNDTTFWPTLMIFTGHRQKMKYKKFSI